LHLNLKHGIVEVHRPSFGGDPRSHWKEVIDVKDDGGELLHAGFEIERMELNADGTKMMILYANGAGAIMDMNNSMNAICEWDGVMDMYLDSSRTMVVVVSQNDDDGSIRGKIIDLKDGTTNLEWNNVEKMDLSPDGTTVIGRYGDDRTEIKGVKNGEIIFRGDDVREAYFDETGSVVVIHYKDNKLEIINSENTDVFFRKNGVKKVHLNAGRKAIVEYVDGRVEIIDLEYGTFLFGGDNIARATSNPAGTRAVVKYKDGTLKIINLEDCNRDMNFAKLGLQKLRFISSLVNSSFPDTVADFIKKHHGIWDSLNAPMKDKLLQHYFSEKVGTIIQTMHKRKLGEPKSESSNKKRKTGG